MDSPGVGGIESPGVGAFDSPGVGGSDNSWMVANGISSCGPPSSSPRSVMPRLDVPNRCWRPLVRYAVNANTRRYPKTVIISRIRI